MTSDSKKEFLTPSELAERWRVHIGSVERWREKANRLLSTPLMERSSISWLR